MEEKDEKKEEVEEQRALLDKQGDNEEEYE